MKRLDQLTFTRFVAALSVVIYHTGTKIAPFNIYPINPLFISGSSAVGYFFVLSGFVMSLVYYRPEEKFDFKGFWLARFSRIFPIYLISFILACIYFMKSTVGASVAEYLSALFLLQAWIPDYALTFNFPAWSLSIEVFFYLLFPFLAIWMARSKYSTRTWIWLSLVFWAISQVAIFILNRKLPNTTTVNNLLDYFPVTHLSLFILGVVGGMWYVRLGQHNPSNQAGTRWLILLGLALVSAGLLSKGSVGIHITKGLLAPFFLMIVIGLAMETTVVSRILSKPWLVRLGDASYGVYILHMPVRWLLKDLQWLLHLRIPRTEFFYLYVFILVSLSLILYTYVERPARDWLRDNSHRLWLIFGDVIFLAFALAVSYLLRVGLEIRGYLDSLTYAVRMGIPAYLLLLIVFRAYAPVPEKGLLAWAKRVLVPVAILGAAALAGIMFYALNQNGIGSFPRSMLAVNLVLSIGLLFGYRAVIQRWKPTLLE